MSALQAVRGRSERARQAQQVYYARTAGSYHDAHVAHGDPEHERALHWMLELVRDLELESLADVGAGTGRVEAFFQEKLPSLSVTGVEPVRELALGARAALPGARIVRGSGDALPFADGGVDAVCAFGVMHHVADPAPVVREMMRVARRAVFISDANRFGLGGRAGRIVKLVLCKARLWNLVELVRTGFRGYRFSEGDGVFYSYSVYDSLPELAAWADHVVLIPTTQSRGGSWLSPLLTASHLLVCAFRGEGPSRLVPGEPR